MVLEPVLCPTCGSDDIVKHDRSGLPIAFHRAEANVLAHRRATLLAHPSGA